MAKAKKATTNITLLRLKGTPFKSGRELKAQEEIILKEEWQKIERARVRRELLTKSENKIILAPLLKGIKAKFAGEGKEAENVVRVYLTHDDEIQVDIHDKFKVPDINRSLEAITSSLITALVDGYLAVLGLKQEVNPDGGPTENMRNSRSER